MTIDPETRSLPILGRPSTMARQTNTPSPQRTPVRDCLEDGMNATEVDGWTIANTTLAEAAARLLAMRTAGKSGLVVTANLDILRLAKKNPVAGRLLQSALTIFADGMPLVLASRIAGQPLCGRVCGSDLLPLLVPQAIEAGMRVAIMGGPPGSAELAARLLSPPASTSIADSYFVPYDFDTNLREQVRVQSWLISGNFDFVFVGMGFPRQEIFSSQMLSGGASGIFVGVGAAVEFSAGMQKRAPFWMQRSGFEWLFRLYREPTRMFRRYIVNDLPYGLWLLGTALGARVKRMLSKHSY